MSARTQRRYPSMRERILANVRKVPVRSWGMTGECWEWQGTVNARGYGHISIRRPEKKKPWPSKVLVHRLVLQVFCGIPMEAIDVSMHQCSNKRCCNPEHLLPGDEEANREFYLRVERVRAASQPASQPASTMLREPGCDDE